MATAAQINYGHFKETVRHNKAMEAETSRHNLVSEGQGSRSLSLQSQSNMVTKQHYQNLDTEAIRHNLAMEAENKRHNIAGEVNDISKISETQRHNVFQESLAMEQMSEAKRHNIAQESLGTQQLAHTIWYDNEYLKETSRRNLASEAESQRHNKALESINSYEASIKAQQVQETSRHNLRTEQEAYAHNRALEGLEGIKVSADASLKHAQAEKTSSDAQYSANLLKQQAYGQMIENTVDVVGFVPNVIGQFIK